MTSDIAYELLQSLRDRGSITLECLMGDFAITAEQAMDIVAYLVDNNIVVADQDGTFVLSGADAITIPFTRQFMLRFRADRESVHCIVQTQQQEHHDNAGDGADIIEGQYYISKDRYLHNCTAVQDCMPMPAHDEETIHISIMSNDGQIYRIVNINDTPHKIIEDIRVNDKELLYDLLCTHNEAYYLINKPDAWDVEYSTFQVQTFDRVAGEHCLYDLDWFEPLCKSECFSIIRDTRCVRIFVDLDIDC